MSIATNVLSCLSVSTAGLLVYDAGDGIHFVANPDTLGPAHEADVAVGPHPYAAATVVVDAPTRAILITHPLVEEAVTRLKVDAEVLADWLEWCDDVVDEARMDASFDGREDLLLTAVSAAKAHAWSVPAAMAEQVAAVNAA